MKIAIMMRAMDQDSGFCTVTQGMIRSMLKLEPTISYLLMYKKRKWLGHFADYPNAKEVLMEVSSKLLWDQVAVPYTAWKERADVLYNPKFSVPLISPCPVTMGLQEPAWFTRPEEYEKWDCRYQKLMIPLSIRKCAHVFPNSTFILVENRRVLRMPIMHATVTYSGFDPRFRPVDNPSVLDQFRRKYKLPEKFILVLSRVKHMGVRTGDFYPGKRPEIAYRAYMRIREEVQHQLVFAGDHIRDYLLDTEGKEADFGGVKFLKFVPFEELHLLYNLADICVNPCEYEGCPNTVLQAMACGCPMIVAAQGGSADVAEGAALMAKPLDSVDLSEKLLAIICNEGLRSDLRTKSINRANFFGWEKSAKATIDALRGVVDRRTVKPMDEDRACLHGTTPFHPRFKLHHR